MDGSPQFLPEAVWNRLIATGSDETRKALIEGLPQVSEEDLSRLGRRDDVCPICLIPFLAILATEEMSLAMESPATPLQSLGVVSLGCGHLFCRNDISAWISDLNNKCPTCRRPFLSPAEPNEGTAAWPGGETQTILAELERELSSDDGGERAREIMAYLLGDNTGPHPSQERRPPPRDEGRESPPPYSAMFG